MGSPAGKVAEELFPVKRRLVVLGNLPRGNPQLLTDFPSGHLPWPSL